MTTQGQALHTLRLAIKQSGTQFRYNNDNSSSLFHPEKGFAWGYDINSVEDALDQYEANIRADHLLPEEELSDMKTELLEISTGILEDNLEISLKEFASKVQSYLIKRLSLTNALLRSIPMQNP